MLKPRFLSRTDMWLFGIPLAILVVLPLVAWLAVWATATYDPMMQHEPITPEPMWFVLCGVICWVAVPGALFREPFFDSEIIGYYPHGSLGWVVIILFWMAVSLAISFGIRYVNRHAHRRASHLTTR